MTVFSKELRQWQGRIQAAAKRLGLDFNPVIFDVLDWDNLAEVVSYKGLPDHYSHWKYGEEYLNMRKSFSYGLSKIYEMVTNANPSVAYLLEENRLIDQKLVMAHVCAHVDFFRNNAWFEPTDRNMLATSRAAAERIDRYREKFGEEAVDDFLTECMKIENLVDFRIPYLRLDTGRKDDSDTQGRKKEEVFRFRADLPFLDDFLNPPEWLEAQREKSRLRQEKATEVRKGLRFPAKPVRDVLLFLLRFAPLEEWQRDILDIVRQETYYLLPQGLTKVSNEGWAAYWHSELMVKRGLAASGEIVDYARHNAGTLGSPGLNPYKLGLVIYFDIEYRWDTGRHGLLWEKCGPYMDTNSRWDDFVIFKNIQRESEGNAAERWSEWCTLKETCRKGLCGFPRDLYTPGKLVKWWCEYNEAEGTLSKLHKELNENRVCELESEIRLDITWYSKLHHMKIAWRSGETRRISEPIPELFYELDRKYPGKVALGMGRKKIFEVRRRINDHSFINEFFTRILFEKMPMFSYKRGGGGVAPDHWGIDKADFESVKKKLLFSLFNLGEPVIEIINARYGGPGEKPYSGRGLYLRHLHEGADLRSDEVKEVLKALFKMWHHPVYLETIVAEEERQSSVPSWVLQQMGMEAPGERKTKRGLGKVFFTTDGANVMEQGLKEVEFAAPY